jgi:hypothetical protein
MTRSTHPVSRVGALLLAAATLTWSAPMVHAQLSPPPTPGAPTLCLDNGMNVTFATAVSADNRGNTYVTGGKRLNDRDAGLSRGSTFTTIKYDAGGRAVWSRSYQGSFGCFDHARAIATDNAGRVYVTGTVWLRGNDLTNPFVDRSQRAYATIKYDADGTLQWVSQYFVEGDKKNEPWAIAVDPHGDVYVTGLSDSGRGGPQKEIATVKYDGQNGQQLWAARYAGGRGILSASGMELTPRGLYVAGTVCTELTQKGNCSDFAFAVLNYDTSGALRWTAQYQNGVGFASQATSLTADRSENVYVTGTSCSTPYIFDDTGDFVRAGCDEADYATVKMTPRGATAWIARYHGVSSGNYVPEAIAVDDSENVYVSGSGAREDQGFHTVKYDRDGQQSWISLFEGTTYASPKAIAVNARGQMYVAGLVLHAFKAYFAVVAYDVQGAEIWNDQVQGLDRTRDWTAAAVALDEQGRLRVTGGTLDMYDWGLVDSWYLTNLYSADGNLLWTRQF